MKGDKKDNSAQAFFVIILVFGFMALVVFGVLGVITNGFEGPPPPLDLDTLPPD